MSDFGRRSTAEEVSRGVDLTGRYAIVTGANTGIGRETARVLALRGCRVAMACRNLDKGDVARREILEAAKGTIPAARLLLMQLDLASLESVRIFAKDYLANDWPLHLLVNNAGVMLPDRRLTRDGFEHHLGINHLGHFLLTNLLLERLCESAPSRVVVVASDAMHMAGIDEKLEDLNWNHRRYSGWRAYASSKLMNLMFARELERRVHGRGVAVNALHPGVIKTELARDQRWYMLLVGLLMWPFMKNVECGAATTLFAATAPELADAGGRYFANCMPARMPKIAQNDTVCVRLWKLSERLTGLSH